MGLTIEALSSKPIVCQLISSRPEENSLHFPATEGQQQLFFSCSNDDGIRFFWISANAAAGSVVSRYAFSQICTGTACSIQELPARMSFIVYLPSDIQDLCCKFIHTVATIMIMSATFTSQCLYLNRSCHRYPSKASMRIIWRIIGTGIQLFWDNNQIQLVFWQNDSFVIILDKPLEWSVKQSSLWYSSFHPHTMESFRKAPTGNFHFLVFLHLSLQPESNNVIRKQHRSYKWINMS